MTNSSEEFARYWDRLDRTVAKNRERSQSEFETITIVIEPAKEGGFSSYIMEIPGVNSQGETVDEAREMTLEAYRELRKHRQQKTKVIAYYDDSYRDGSGDHSTRVNITRFKPPQKVDGYGLNHLPWSAPFDIEINGKIEPHRLLFKHKRQAIAWLRGDCIEGYPRLSIVKRKS